jgi:hypothetical protein
MNPELVTIPAAALKWCPYYFMLYPGKLNPAYLLGIDGSINMRSKHGENFTLDKDEPVWVNPTDYTAAVIEHIREIIPNMVGINKYSHGVFAFTDYVELRIAADPWPWAETGEWRV